MAGKTVILLLCFVAIIGTIVACSRRNDSDFALHFAAEKGDAEVTVLRFYLHDVELLGANGRDYPMQLRPVPPWQSDKIALIDLAGDTATERNDVVYGSVADAPDAFVGVRLTVGVPFDLNHANPLTAAAPLNRGDMFWAWQNGYKFLRVDLAARAGAEPSSFHLGSTGCSSASVLRPPSLPCAQPNRMIVELRGFDPLRQPVKFTLLALMHAMESANKACTGDYHHDTACAAAYALTGLDTHGVCAGGICGQQQLFAP